MSDPLLKLLQAKARLSNQELAEALNLSNEAVDARIAAWEEDGTILGYQAVVDDEKAGESGVAAFIEVKLTPERGGGFDRLLPCALPGLTRYHPVIWLAGGMT